MMIFVLIAFSAGLICAIVLCCKVLYKLHLNVHAFLRGTPDIGVARYNLKDGISVMYRAPAPSDRALRGYQIYTMQKRKEKFFVAEWADGARSAEYDLVLYDACNRVIDIMRIAEVRGGRAYTHKYTLPAKTDYLSLSVRSVNGGRLVSGCAISLKTCAHILFAAVVSALFACVIAWVTCSIVFLAQSGLADISFGGWMHLLLASGFAAFGCSVLISLYPVAAGACRAWAERIRRSRLKGGGHGI